MLIFTRHVNMAPLIYLCSILVAILFFMFQKEFIIWRGSIDHSTIHTSTCITKKVSLYYSHNKQLVSEIKHIAWTNNKQENLNILINSYFTFLYDKGHMQQQILVQRVLLNHTESDLFISFNQSPYTKEMSIADKISFTQALCSTIKEAYPISTLYFLVNDTLLQDPHLDCSCG